MRHEIILAPEAAEDFKALKAVDRAAVRDAMEQHLRHEPTKTSRSRIKRLRGMRRPQYRLRVEDIRVFYDVTEEAVEVLAIVAKSARCCVARATWRASGRDARRAWRTHVMKEVALSEVKDDLSRYLRQAAKEEIVITRHGKAAGVLIGFESEDDWFDYRLENDPRFLDRIAAARASLRAGRGGAAGGRRREDRG